MASGILLASLPGNQPFLPQEPVQLGIDELIPLAEMLALASLIAHAELFQNSARSWIVFEVRREDSVQAEVLESVAEHLLPRFGRVALSPIRHSKPVAELSMMVLLFDS